MALESDSSTTGEALRWTCRASCTWPEDVTLLSSEKDSTAEDPGKLEDSLLHCCRRLLEKPGSLKESSILQHKWGWQLGCTSCCYCYIRIPFKPCFLLEELLSIILPTAQPELCLAFISEPCPTLPCLTSCLGLALPLCGLSDEHKNLAVNGKQFFGKMPFLFFGIACGHLSKRVVRALGSSLLQNLLS